jgi:hypothetical protein
MKNTIKVHAILMIAWIIVLLAVIGFSMAACGASDGGNGDGGKINAVQHICDVLKDLRLSSRSVIGMDSVSTGYRSARVDKYIDGYTGYPDHHHIDGRDWTGVGDGDIKLDDHGLNGDGWELWVFITIQGGDHYVVFANNDHADELPMGITDYEGQEGQVWFYRWE